MRYTAPVAATAWIALAMPAALSAQSATVTGTVRSETQQSVRGALVSMPDLELSTVTNDNGIYRINVPESRVQGQQVRIVVQSIGFRTTEVLIQLRPGTIQQNFLVAEEAISLDEVVVTGTAGRQERRAQAAVVSTIDAARVAEFAPVQSVANLLQARTPGVMLRNFSGSSGVGQTIRIRGQASIGLSNDPLVFIDGIMADSRNRQIYGVGNAFGSRLNDLKIEDIESIEIVKGPAAATLYGADASAGVINIITKRGRAQGGFTQSVTVEYGEASPNFTPPDNYSRCVGNNLNFPACQGQPPGTVLKDNPLLREGSFHDGRYRNVNWTMRGGGANYGVYLSLGADQDRGTLPNNQYGHVSGRAAFDFVASEKLRMDFGFWLGRTITQLPHNDNNIYGYLGGGFLGYPHTRGLPQDGWYGNNRQTLAIASLETYDKSLRVQPRVAVNYSPFTWFTNRLTVGGDLTRTRAYQFWPRNDAGWFDAAPLNTGQIGEARESVDNITIDYLGNITWSPRANLRGDFSFGSQILTYARDITNATGQGLVTNQVRNVNSAATLSGGGQFFEHRRQVGLLGQAQFSWNEKVYLQVGARIDQASVFGRDSEPFLSPKVGVSYILSDESFFRSIVGDEWITTLKLRTAYGETGRQPTGGILATYTPNPYAIESGAVQIGVTPSNPGNPDLRPERGKELELGFDAGFLRDRLGIELTYFRKETEDLILGRPLPASLGFAANPSANIGGVLNRGFEVAANARLLTWQNVGWEVRGAVNTLRNEILDLGDVAPGSGFTRNVVGRPIGAHFDYVIREIDLANNRVIVSDTMEFLGNPQNLPGWEATFSSTLTLFRDLSLYAQLDARGDLIVYNSTDQFRDRQNGNSKLAALGPLPPDQRPEPIDQVDYLRKFGPFVRETAGPIARGSVQIGYKEPGDFVRLREVSVNYRVPRSFTQRYIRAQTAQVTLAMRNLRIWTDYTGLDPETGNFLTVPQDRRWTARFNFTF
jgi:TonB-linked SusC/RagA family outer membrane protein